MSVEKGKYLSRCSTTGLLPVSRFIPVLVDFVLSMSGNPFECGTRMSHLMTRVNCMPSVEWVSSVVAVEEVGRA